MIQIEKATSFHPRGNGSWERVCKYPCSDLGQLVSLGWEQTCFPSFFPGRAQVLQVAANGDLAHFYDIPGLSRIVGVVLDGDHRLFMCNDTTAFCVDPGSGDPLARRDLVELKDVFMAPRLEGGGFLLGHADGVQALDADLKIVANWLPGFKPARMRELPGGWLFVMGRPFDARLVALGRDGQVVLESKSVEPNSVCLHPNGTVGYIESGEGGKKSLVIFFPAEPGIRRREVSKEARALLPLADGSSLLLEDAATGPRLSRLNSQGKTLSGYAFPKDRVLKQLFVRTDDQMLYLVADRTGSNDRELYTIPLDAPSKGGGLGGLFGGGDVKPKALLNFSTPMLPVVLQNGTLAVFRPGGVDLFDAQGKALRSFTGLEALTQDAVGGSAPAARRIGIGALEGDLAPHWDSYMPQILTWFPMEDGAVYLGRRGHPVPNPGEKAIICVTTLPAEQAAAEMGRSPEQTPEHGTLPDEQRFPDSRRALKATPEAISVLNVEEQTTLQLRRLTGGERFTAAVPVQDGEMRFVAAGTDRGRFLWLDANGWFPAEAEREFTVGAPIRRIEVVAGRRIFVTAEGGCSLIFEPAVQRLEAPAASVSR
ncbi:MAG: hypothetical protein ACYCW6_00470 [Candidatus Xenobia bacterium]